MFPDYIKAFNSDLESVIQFTGTAILVLGFSNFIWYVLNFLPDYLNSADFSGSLYKLALEDDQWY
jgi:hypothetical protein